MEQEPHGERGGEQQEVRPLSERGSSSQAEGGLESAQALGCVWAVMPTLPGGGTWFQPWHRQVHQDGNEATEGAAPRKFWKQGGWNASDLCLGLSGWQCPDWDSEL